MRKNEGHYINEIEGGFATVRMFGTIGQDLNGHYLAQDLSFLSEEVQEIDLLINSEGGSVIQGLSIIAAIQSSPVKINARIVGVAISMAGVIAMACDNRSMVDFGRLMIHDPAFAGKRRLSAKEKNAVDNIKGILVAIYKKRSTLSEDEISNLMTEETWFNAEEALSKGFINSIETTEDAENLTEASFETILNHSNEKFNQKRVNAMSKNVLQIAALAAVFEGITENSTEEDVVNLIQGKDEQIQSLKDQLQELNDQSDKVTNLETTVSELKKKVAETKVDAAINAGKILEASRDKMVDLEVANEGSIDAITEAVPAKAANIQDTIENGPEGREKWSFEDWSKKDPKGLDAMKSANPAMFNRLFKSQYGDPAEG